MEGKEFTKLENAIKGLKKPELSVSKKSQMRENLLHSINNNIAAENYPSLTKFQKVVQKVSSKVQPTEVFKAKIRESVLTAIEKAKFQNSFLSSFARNWQKVLATSMIFLISMTTFAAVYIADIPVTKAAPRTTLLEFTGNVDIYRDDLEIEVYEGMVLQQGDIVITGKKSTAVIRFIDDSLSRLSPESELRLRRIYKDQEKKSITEVEVELNKGRVWNQVVNLSGKKSKFKVEAKNIKAETNQKASFDIKVNAKHEPEVAVFENKVQVELPDDQIVKKQYLLEGYVIAGASKKPEVEKIQFNSIEDEVWIEVNKVKDREYKKEIDKEKTEDAKDKAGFTPENPLYSAKKLNESTKLLLANDADKTKVKIDIAVKRLNEAVVLIEQGKSPDDLLNEFDGIFNEISGELKNSSELQEYLEDIIAEEEKSLSTVLPDSPKYKVKEALRVAKKKTATTDEKAKEVMLDGTEEKLIEIKELIKEDKTDYVQEALKDINEELNVVKNEEANDEEDVTEEQVETISSVKVLEDVIEEEGTDDENINNFVENTKEVFDEEDQISVDNLSIEEPIQIQLQVVNQDTLHPAVSDVAIIISID